MKSKLSKVTKTIKVKIRPDEQDDLIKHLNELKAYVMASMPNDNVYKSTYIITLGVLIETFNK